MFKYKGALSQEDFPVKSLNSIPTPSAEQKECVGERIQLKLPLNKSGQTIDSSAQICVSAGNVYFLGLEFTQHDSKMRRTISTAQASAPL